MSRELRRRMRSGSGGSGDSAIDYRIDVSITFAEQRPEKRTLAVTPPGALFENG
jgi:hypothetical protein